MPDTSRSFKLFIIGVVLIFASLLPYYWGAHQVATTTVVRAALDIGSGATKLRVSEVDLKENKIVRTIVNQQIAVPYQLALSKSDDQVFDEQIMKEGIDAIQTLKKIAMDNGAEKMVGIATASFRKAQNGQAFVEKIFEESGIPVYIVDQDIEGELGFYAVEATTPVDEDRMIVWDIGGGSLQFTAIDKNGNMIVYRGHEASIPFRQYVIQNIQGRDVKNTTTPNPMTTEDMENAEKHARDLASRVNAVFKERLQDSETDVVGVGSIFSLGIEPLVKKSSFTVKELTKAVKPLAGKTDEELGGGDFADVQVTNALLVLGFMNELKIKEVTVVDVNAADGAFFIKRFWKPQEAVIEEAQ